MRTRILAVSGIVLLCMGLIFGAVVAVAAPILGHPVMVQIWDRTDRPVEEGRVARTWMWGPESFNVLREPYSEAPGGERIVAYLDKSRMEVTNPNADQRSPWFVTNGLLTREMISGQLQLGDATFEQRTPAQIPIAGDPDDQTGPTYATFSNLLGPVAERRAAVIETINRAGQIGQNGALGNFTDYVYFVPETGHNIPGVFWDFLNSSGLVFENGAYRTANLFQPTFFATGFPITEAYWAEVKVGGQVQPVLVQAYERRVLTFTPSNPEGWQVEMGNAGRHYHTWRYGAIPEPTPTPGPTTANVSIISLSYQPATITIGAGDSVTWTNNESELHTVTSRTGVFSSPAFGQGGTFTFRFDTPGTYPYFCAIHPEMSGTVVVQ